MKLDEGTINRFKNIKVTKPHKILVPFKDRFKQLLNSSSKDTTSKTKASMLGVRG